MPNMLTSLHKNSNITGADRVISPTRATTHCFSAPTIMGINQRGLIMSKKKSLTQSRLKELLSYDHATGLFTWSKSRGCIKKGDKAGSLNTSGYLTIRVDRRLYRSNRLAFLYMEGYSPENSVDHINRDKTDNRWDNLRHVSQSCNIRNSKKSLSNKSGVTGVVWDKARGRWHAQITVNYKNIHFGRHRKFINAVMARWEAEKKYNFPNCNNSSSAFLYLKENGVI